MPDPWVIESFLRQQRQQQRQQGERQRPALQIPAPPPPPLPDPEDKDTPKGTIVIDYSIRGTHGLGYPRHPNPHQ